VRLLTVLIKGPPGNRRAFFLACPSAFLIELHVIASEAKQSSASPSLLDCFVASLLAMTNPSIMKARSWA
jgi:hypothetical protein